MKQLLVLLITGALFLALPMPVISAMSSTNYLIYADSVETGGGLSTGGIYSLEQTTGESPAGSSTSSVYEIRAGYQYMERGYLSLLVSSNSINLGTLSESAVNSGGTILTVGTDSATGYSLSISGVSGSALASVTDGTVSAGSEEYGFSASGPESQVTGDVAVSPSTLVAATTTPVSNSDTTMTFKASMSGSSVSGSYSQTVTMTASANL